MGFTEALALLFIVLKVFGIVTWSWWLVLLPEIIAVVFYAILAISVVLFNVHIWKGLKQQWILEMQLKQSKMESM